MNKEELTGIIKGLIGDALKAQGETDTVKIDELIAAKLEEIRTSTDARVKELVKGEIDSKKKEEETKLHTFKNFADFAQAVAKERNGVDDRLKNWCQSINKATGTNEAIGEDGGYLVPEEFRQTLLERAIEQSNIMQSALQIPMATNAVKIPYIADTTHASNVFGGVQFYWVDEGAQRTAAKPKLGQIDLRLKKVAGLCYVTDELLEDSPISMEPLLTNLFSKALGWTLDGVFIAGTGAGQPLGVLNAPCLVSVAKETGQSATTILCN